MFKSLNERSRGRRVMLPVMAAILMLSGLSAYSVLGSSHDDVTWYACRDQRSGVLSNVQENQPPSCGFRQEVISWSQTGPEGEPSLSNRNMVSDSEAFSLSPGQSETLTIGCPGDQAVIGGGAQIDSDPSQAANRGLTMFQNAPTDTEDGWVATVVDSRAAGAIAATGTLHVHAICVDDDINGGSN